MMTLKASVAPQVSAAKPKHRKGTSKPLDVNSTQDLTRLYLTNIGKLPLLSNEEEIEQTVRIKRLRDAYRHRLLAIPDVLHGVQLLLREVSLRQRRLDRVIEVAVSETAKVKAIRRALPSLLTDLKTIDTAHRNDVARARSGRLTESAQQQVLHRIASRQKQVRRLLSETPVRTEVFHDLYEKSTRVSSRCHRRIQRLKLAYEKAKNRFVQHNLRLVVPLAKRYRDQGVSFLDLLQEGNGGLLRAIEKFDPDLGHRFSTYANWWINQALLQAIRTQARVIRLPASVIKQVRQVRMASQQFVRAEQRYPQVEELAAHAQLSYEQTVQSVRLLRKTSSIDQLDEEDNSISEFIAGEDGEEGSRAVLQGELCRILKHAMDELNQRERRVVTLRYGLDDGHQRTLAEVGDKLSLSRESIRQIEASAFRKLRKVQELCSLN